MEIRLAAQVDVLEILTLFTQTKAYFKQEKIDQWQGEYPNMALILADIGASQCYVLKDNELLLGVIVVSLIQEDSYQQLSPKMWNTATPYTVIHRLAVNPNYRSRGVGMKLLEHAEKITLAAGLTSIRTDTHADNGGMRLILTRSGYRCVGTIRLIDGSPRIAYDKLLFK